MAFNISELSLTQLYDLKNDVKKRIRDKENDVFESALEEQKEKTLKKLKTYNNKQSSLSFFDKWISNEFGRLCECISDDCWYRNNQDRLEEFTSIYVNVLRPEKRYCDVCIENLDEDEESSSSSSDNSNGSNSSSDNDGELSSYSSVE